MRIEFWLALIPLASIQSLARADDAYPIKVKQAGLGVVVLVERSENSVAETKYVSAEGKIIPGETEKTVETYVYRETFLAQEVGKPPTRLRRQYEKAQVTEDKTTTDLPYHGKTFLIEKKKDGKYHFQLEGGAELTSKEAEVLDGEFNKVEEFCGFEQHLLPTQPVKVGETWKLDMAPIVKVVGPVADIEGDAVKAEGTARLLKVYTKEGRKFGHFTCQFQFPVKSIGSGPDKEEALKGSQIAAEFDFDYCIDGEYVAGFFNQTYRTEVSTTVLKDGSKKIVTFKGENKETDKELPK